MRDRGRCVRVDSKTHAELQRIAREYARRWGRHVSLADAVRMGLTLLVRSLGRKGEGVRRDP